MKARRPKLLPVSLAAALAACSGGSSGGPKIDPSAPDEVAFQSALAHYAAGTAAQAAARNPAEPDPAGKSALAVAEFGAAQSGFRQLLATYPASVRVDNSAYLEGRSRYEIGTTTGLRSDFQSASTLLEAAISAHPASVLVDSMAYFAGRSLFRIAELDRAQPAADPSAQQAAVVQDYDAARAHFARSIAASPAGIWADNAAYYRGRCDFEVGYLEVHPLDPLALPGTSTARFDLAETELGEVLPASSYYDNARYYLGRSHFEEPAAAPAARIANLDAAVAAFGGAIGVAGSSFADGARYWRGRAHYALAFQRAPAGGPVDEAELALVLADMKAIAPASVYADNALFYLAKAYLNFAAPGPYCTAPRSGDALPASACAARAALLAAYPQSGYVAQADAYLAANGCTCP